MKSYRIRLSYAVLAAIMIMTILRPSPVHAVEVYIPPLTATSGQTVDVPIMIDEIENLAGIKMVVKYDSGLLTFARAEKTPQTSSLMHVVNDRKPGILIVVMAGARGIKGKAFPVITLSFETRKDVREPVRTPLEITEVQLMSDQLKEVKSTVRVNPVTILPPDVRNGS